MSVAKSIRLLLAAATIVVGPAAGAQSGDCRGAVTGGTCAGSPAGQGGCTLTAGATFICHDGGGTGCDFVFGDQLFYLDHARRQWVPVYPWEEEPWSESCGSSQAYTWSGTLTDLPAGSYKLLCGFWASGQWVYADPSYFMIPPY